MKIWPEYTLVDEWKAVTEDSHTPTGTGSADCVSGRGSSGHHRHQLVDHDQEVSAISVDNVFLGEGVTSYRPWPWWRIEVQAQLEHALVGENGANAYDMKRYGQYNAVLGYKNHREYWLQACISCSSECCQSGETWGNFHGGVPGCRICFQCEVENVSKLVEGVFRLPKNSLEEREVAENECVSAWSIPCLVRHAVETILRTGNQFGGPVV